MVIKVLFKRINEISYSVEKEFELKMESFTENVSAENNFSYIPVIKDTNVVVNIKTQVNTTIENEKFRTISLDMDLILGFSSAEKRTSEQELIDEVHSQYENIHEIISNQIVSTITALDDLPIIKLNTP